MSIQSEIDRIRENISASYAAVEEKGGTAPELQCSGNLPGAIRSIDTGANLPSGTADQVIGFDSDGKAVAKGLENDMLPVVDVAHGGTGQITGADAIKSLIEALTPYSLSVNVEYPNIYYPYYNSSNEPGRTSLPQLRKGIVGTTVPIGSASTDYTTSRARAISLHTAIPESGLVNGCLYGIYS